MARHVTALLIVLVLALLACGKADPASTAKCASQTTGEDCQKCCTKEGRNGYRSVNGRCECL
ncbi:MAG: hypothetical protein U0263_26510 [Polyangiaceae bacterium]